MCDLMKKIITLEEERSLAKDFNSMIRILKLISDGGKLSRSIAIKEDLRNVIWQLATKCPWTSSNKSHQRRGSTCISLGATHFGTSITRLTWR